MRTIDVDLDNRSYPVLLGRDTLSSFGEICRKFEVPETVVIVSDEIVAGLYLRQVRNALRHSSYRVESIVIPHGERQKTLHRANGIMTKLINLGIKRQAALVALGGGVIGDLTGFVASTFRRGITFVQCPTTLLSQVDSSVGGKVGVNHPHAKNAIGTFYQPRFVFIDIGLLHTLPKRQVISGAGEVLKYGLVGGDAIFEFLRTSMPRILSLNLETVEEVAARCISLKARCVSEDEREENPEGGRAILNIGHAVAQTLETLSRYKLSHGEAVLLGLRTETEIARSLDLLSKTDYEKIRDYLGQVPLDDISLGRRHSGAALFSKNKLVRFLTKARFVLPAGIGKIVFRNHVSEEVIRGAVSPLFASNR